MTNFGTIVQYIAIAAIPLIFAITLHEAAHGWIASKLGDKTALMLGRVTMNPAKHIDPIGTVVVPIIMLILSGFIFGWAKPVPVNWNNLNKPRRDMALVAAAGPAANLVMAFFWAIVAKFSEVIFSHPSVHVVIRDIATYVHLASLFGIMINCVLFVLNLVPIPPLDGSRIISSILPPNAASVYERIEPFGIWILLALIFLGILGHFIYPPILSLIGLIKSLFGVQGKVFGL